MSASPDRARSMRTYSEPMKPAPPVTRIFTGRDVTGPGGGGPTPRECGPGHAGLSRGRPRPSGRPVAPAPARLPSHARHHLGRRHRLPLVADHQGRLEAADAGVRQTHDLLPAVDAGQRGHLRDPRHHHARGPGPVPAPARRRLPVGPGDRLRRAGAPRGPGAGVHPRRGLHRRRVGGPGARRQHLPRHRPGAAAPHPHRARRRRGLRLPGGQPQRVRRRGVRRRGPGGLHRGEAGQAQVPLRGARPVLLRQQASWR